jgi:hypothetical protein
MHASSYEATSYTGGSSDSSMDIRPEKNKSSDSLSWNLFSCTINTAALLLYYVREGKKEFEV